MTNQELAAALRLCGSEKPIDNCPKCPFFEGYDPERCIPKMTAACADALVNSDTHIMALQKEIEGLRIELQAMRNAANGYKKMMPQWVSVEERFPDPEVWALCLLRRGDYEVLQFDGTADEWRGQNPKTSYFPEAVTHWMPLPDGPKEAKKDG